MKITFRIVGAVLLFAVLAFVWGTAASAQGPTETPTPAAGTACTDVATFVSDITIPDNSVVAPVQTFTKTWRLRNRGTCTWGANYTFAFVSGPAMTSQTVIAVPETAPTATADLSVPMTAPANAGTAQGFWRLRSPSGRAFGPRVWILVDVRSGAPGGAPVPALAPPLVASGAILDDPARAVSFGSAIPSLPAGNAEWLSFDYDNGGNALPRPPVTIMLLNGVTNGLSFEVYSPETMLGGWSNNKPVGHGTTEVIPNCIENSVNVGTCTTNNLSWTGGFGLNGTYFVRVINSTGAAVAPQLIIGGPGLAQCVPSGGTNTATNNQGLPFAQIQCTSPGPGTPTP